MAYNSTSTMFRPPLTLFHDSWTQIHLFLLLVLNVISWFFVFPLFVNPSFWIQICSLIVVSMFMVVFKCCSMSLLPSHRIYCCCGFFFIMLVLRVWLVCSIICNSVFSLLSAQFCNHTRLVENVKDINDSKDLWKFDVRIKDLWFVTSMSNKEHSKWL